MALTPGRSRELIGASFLSSSGGSANLDDGGNANHDGRTQCEWSARWGRADRATLGRPGSLGGGNSRRLARSAGFLCAGTRLAEGMLRSAAKRPRRFTEDCNELWK